jgi:hypothetical protein
MKYLNSFYKSLLLLNLAAMPSAALALDPVIDGSKTAVDIAITSSVNWTTLLGPILVVIPAGAVFNCEVTCTSSVNKTAEVTDQDYFYAAFNSTNPSTADACVRPFDFPQDDTLIDDADKMVVASTCYIPSLSGAQNFYCLGRKGIGEVNTTVDNTSAHVICVDDQG